MKIRTSFVTNSSSSSYICIKLKHSWEDIFLLENNLSLEKIDERMENGNYDDILLKDGMLEVILGEDGYQFIAWMLDESDLEKECLNSLKKRLIVKIKEAYNIDLTEKNLEFSFGEIYR